MTPLPAEPSDLVDLPADELVRHLGDLVMTELVDVLPDRPDVAIVDVPTTANWGDNAIWQGERAALRRMGVRAVYEPDDALYDQSRLDRSLGADGVVLMHGGGSLGDLYPARTRFRNHLLATLRHRRIVHLPQSIHFESQAEAEELKRLIGEHPDFTLLARDQKSFDYAVREFDCDVRLCPDMAFAMGPRRAPTEPTHDVLWIDRLGPERVEREDVPASDDVLRSDWKPAAGAGLRTTLDALLPMVNRKLYARRDPLARWLRSVAVDAMPNSRQRMAERFLAQGRVIVSDRLHGAIMGTIIGRPTIILDNRIGKPRAFYDTWMWRGRDVSMAEGPREALDRARAIAGGAS